MSVSSMKRLTVFAFRADSDRILRALMNLRCVEVRKLELSEAEPALRRLQDEDMLPRIEQQLSDIRSAIPLLNRYSTRRSRLGRIVHQFDPEVFGRDGSEQKARETVRRTLEYEQELRQVNAELARLSALMQSLIPWMDYDAPMNDAETKRTSTLFGSCPPGADIALLQNRLEEGAVCCELVSADRTASYLCVTFLREERERVSAELAAAGFVPADFGEVSLPPEAAYAKASEERGRLEQELETTQEKLRELAESLELVEILCDVEETNRTVALLRQRLAQTDRCTVLEGWVPGFTQDAVEEKLNQFECAFELDEPLPGEEPPVLLRNNQFAMNFEWVVGMYAYPKYGRYDPTFIMSIFYFFIFGLMFADVGYGLLLVIGCVAGIRLMHPRPGMRRMLTMFAYCGVSAILMGVLFGGWFGDLPIAMMENLFGASVDTSVGHFFGSGLWFNPLDDPMMFLILSLAVGGVHLVAGMVIRFVILCKDGNAGEAICTIAPYWVLFGGLVTLIFDQTVGMIVSIAGGVLILLLNGYGVRNPFKRLLKGLGGLYGLVSYASDLLSYSRILALCLVAAVIAKVINMITLLGATGWLGMLVMVVVLVAGHLLNLAINVLGSFVHTARLQYLEFFGKFYEDGGKAFEPAVPADQYTEQVKF